MATLRRMPEEASTDTAVRRRTRRAIIDAAVHLWARDFHASLSAIASEAGVSRSTLHRYFAERDALIDAALQTAWEVFGDADACRSRSAGPLEQLCQQLQGCVALGDWVLFLWTDPSRFDERPGSAELFAESPDGTSALLLAAQESGEIDAELPLPWLTTVYYSLLYAGAEAAATGTVPVFDAGRFAVRAFRNGVRP